MRKLFPYKLLNCLLPLVMALSGTAALAEYKARTWTLHARQNYAAQQTSEGVTIALQPLFRNALAAELFDKNDMITRGIMPLAVVIFNDNDFAVQIDGISMELIVDDQHFHTLQPNEAVHILFQKGGIGGLKPPFSNPIPKVDSANTKALEDFEYKFMGRRIIGPHDQKGGFLYFRLPPWPDLAKTLSKTRLYIPEIIRKDKDTPMIYFEIDLMPAFVGTSNARP